MEIRQIRERISAAFKSAGRFLRETIALPYAKLYIAAAFALTAFFVVLGFPFDVFIRAELQKMEQRGLRSVEVGEIEFNLIGNSYIDSLILGAGSESEIAIRDLRFNIAVNPVTTLLYKTLKGSIGAGEFRFSDGDSSFSCIPTGEFRLASDPGSGVPRNGFLNLELQNVALKGITIKGFAIPAVRFGSIVMNSELHEGELRIIKFDGSGPDLRGSIRGSITLAPYVRNSTLNLVIDIDAQSKLVQDYRILLGNLANQGDGRLRLNLTGTLSAPSVAFPGAEKGHER